MVNSKGQTNCHCGCGENYFDPRILTTIEGYRDKFWPGKKIVYNCVCRCIKHNAAVGGATLSRHISDKKSGRRADAADFNIQGVTPHDVRAALDPVHSGGMELNTPTWVHLDLRPYKARFNPNT